MEIVKVKVQYKVFEISIKVIEKYIYSPIYTYLCSNPGEEIILNDIDEKTFGIIVDILNGKINENHVSDQIKKYINHYGLTNDVLSNYELYLTNQQNTKYIKIKKLLDGDLKYIITDLGCAVFKETARPRYDFMLSQRSCDNIKQIRHPMNIM